MAQAPTNESEFDDPSVYLEENWDESQGPFRSGLTWDEAVQMEAALSQSEADNKRAR